jgi:NADH pyrophosphatase NudC (nudix superfamily)
MIFNYCPDCGGRCEFKGGKAYKCLTCSKNWFNQPEVATAAIINNKSGQILFVKRQLDPAKGTLTIPGGFVDNGESIEKAIKREVYEEGGVTIDGVNYFGSYPSIYRYKNYAYPCVVIIFTATTGEAGKTNDRKEVSEILWLAPQEITLERIGLTDIRQAVSDYLKSIPARRS